MNDPNFVVTDMDEVRELQQLSGMLGPPHVHDGKGKQREEVLPDGDDDDTGIVRGLSLVQRAQLLDTGDDDEVPLFEDLYKVHAAW
jgi:hypothetical protein